MSCNNQRICNARNRRTIGNPKEETLSIESRPFLQYPARVLSYTSLELHRGSDYCLTLLLPVVRALDFENKYVRHFLRDKNKALTVIRGESRPGNGWHLSYCGVHGSSTPPIRKKLRWTRASPHSAFNITLTPLHVIIRPHSQTD